MALAPFFFRAYAAIGAQVGITREELESLLTGQVIGIHLGEACSVEGNEKWIAELLINLLARLYPAISITGADICRRHISEIARSINPSIEITDGGRNATITVVIGAPIATEKTFLASASGWIAYVGYDPGKAVLNGSPNPYASGAAAALAAWRIFEVAIQNKDMSTQPETSLSLLDYSMDSGAGEKLPPVNVGEIAIAGIGAVGNPAIWAWARHKGLSGHLHLIDSEGVELSNLQRYCLPSLKDEGISKVQLADREFQRSELTRTLWPCSLEDFARDYAGIDKLPTICISVDNVAGRRTAQALLPQLVVNGWTSSSGLGASWHRFTGRSACLGCLYHPSGLTLSQTEIAASALGIPHKQLADIWVTEKSLEPAEIAVVEKHLGLSQGQLAEWAGKRVQDIYTGVICGQVGVDLPSIGRVATVPLAHQSVLAGILMAAELVKRSDQGLEAISQSQPLVVWDDVLMPPPSSWITARAKESGCFCGDPAYQEVYLEKWP